MFLQTIGPLTRDGGNVVIGVLHGGEPGGDQTCKEGLVHHKAWTNLRDSSIQIWIKKMVPDVVIRGVSTPYRNNYLSNTLYFMSTHLETVLICYKYI